MGQAKDVTVDRVEQVDDQEWAVTWRYEGRSNPARAVLHLARGEWGCTVLSDDVPEDVVQVLIDAAYEARDARRAA